MTTFLLIVHGLSAVALLGALTHQSLAVIWPGRKGGGFTQSFRAVSGPAYTNASVVLYLTTFALGAYLYPAYRVTVRTWIERARLWEISGLFELKEQVFAVGLGLLPLYWLLWRRAEDGTLASARAWVTGLLCLMVWYGFIAGHLINNTRGMFGT
ncbi:MAG: hypothetical protein AB7P12_14805 [Alphaproteobacteria bacterium]